VALAARGARETGVGVETVTDAGERKRHRRRAATVVVETTVVAALLTAVTLAVVS